MVGRVDVCFTSWNSKLLFFRGRIVFFNPENHWFKAIKVKDQYCWPVSAGSCTSLSFHTPGARVNYLTRLMYINNAKYIPKPTF